MKTRLQPATSLAVQRPPAATQIKLQVQAQYCTTNQAICTLAGRPQHTTALPTRAGSRHAPRLALMAADTSTRPLPVSLSVSASSPAAAQSPAAAPLHFCSTLAANLSMSLSVTSHRLATTAGEPAGCCSPQTRGGAVSQLCQRGSGGRWHLWTSEETAESQSCRLW
jgi:hypothetical protein